MHVTPALNGGWAAKGACQHSDPELFFPLTSVGRAADQVTSAKAVCARCPVRIECLDFAIESGQDSGVWGGTSEDERRAIRRQRLRRQRALASGASAHSFG